MGSFELVQRFKNYLARDPRNLYISTGQNQMGLLMVRNNNDNKRYVFKSYTTEYHPVTPSRLHGFIGRTPTFKGENIDNYIFVGYSFSILACKLPKSSRSISIILYDFKRKSIDIYGASNLYVDFLKTFIAFAELNNLTVTYDFEGNISRSVNERATQPEIITSEQREKPYKVFLSYSWDSQEHIRWVLGLAAQLIRNGIDVLIDEWDLDAYNNDLQHFMESGIRDSDKVIMICTKNYAERANKRIGGVGVESTIITGEFYDSKYSSKYIPVIRSYEVTLTDSLPSYIKSKFSTDFSKDELYLEKLEELMRKILGIPKYKKPKLGKTPELQSQEI